MYEDSQRLIAYYRDLFVNKANDNADIKGKYEFVPVVSGDSYDSVLVSLRERKALLAFIPPFTYLLFKDGKKPAFSKEDFQIIGAKVSGKQEFYTSLFLVDATCGVVKELADINKYNFTSQRIRIVLGKNTDSASTSRMPMVFLLEQGIVLDRIRRNYETAERYEMLARVRTGTPDQCVVGVLSNTDWDSLKPEGVRSLAMTIPIPYDPLLANRVWWQSLPKEDQEALLRALTSTASVRDASEWNFDTFEHYVGSGVVTEPVPASAGAWEVIFPDGRFDILGLAVRWATGEHRVRLARFVNGRALGGDYDVQEGPSLGTCTLTVQSPGRAVLLCDKHDQQLSELRGAHALPERGGATIQARHGSPEPAPATPAPNLEQDSLPRGGTTPQAGDKVPQNQRSRVATDSAVSGQAAVQRTQGVVAVSPSHTDLPVAAEHTELEIVDNGGISTVVSSPSIAYPGGFGPSTVKEGIAVRRGVEESMLLWSGLRIIRFMSKQEQNEKGTTVWRHAVEATLANGEIVRAELQDDWNMAYMGGGGTGLLFGRTDLGEVRIPFSKIALLKVRKYARPASHGGSPQ